MAKCEITWSEVQVSNLLQNLGSLPPSSTSSEENKYISNREVEYVWEARQSHDSLNSSSVRVRYGGAVVCDYRLSCWEEQAGGKRGSRPSSATLRIQGKPGLCENLLKERERGERKSKSVKEGGGRKKKGKHKSKGKREGGEKKGKEITE